jgi:hypothetical protein
MTKKPFFNSLISPQNRINNFRVYFPRIGAISGQLLTGQLLTGQLLPGQLLLFIFPLP